MQRGERIVGLNRKNLLYRRPSIDLDFTANIPRPHLLGASAIQAAHLTPHLTSTQSQLNAKLQTIQSQNASLAELLKDQEKEIAMLMASLEGLVKGVDGAVEGLNNGIDEIATETRIIDGEMKAL